ncbi:MAG TPA: Flp pilus assembly protein CpaB [Alphaproteobacteria bacterium]|nr:Flp pilus assembly protein CpaB [Alphaproteobacteria bacterium]
MRLKDIIGLVLALILAIGVAFLTRYFLTSKEKPKQVVQVEPEKMNKILIAGRELHRGDRVKPGDLIWQVWPQQSVNSNYIVVGSVKESDLIGSIVREPVGKGEPMVATDLIKPGDKGVLAAILAPGKRAISIDVTAQSASSGLIVPGDRVDVILSKSMSPAGGGAQYGESKLVASNVKVLALDIELGDTHEKPKAAPHVVTLQVSTAEAERITAATKEGSLSLSLHSIEKDQSGPGQVEVKSEEKTRKEGTIILMRGKDKTEIQVQGK